MANYSNIAVATTLSAAIGAGDLALAVASASGYPTPPFRIVLDPGSVANEEVCQVTNVVSTTFTVTRGYDGTTAKSHASGATVIHAVVASDLTDLQAADTTHAALTTTAHGGIVASSDSRLTDNRTPTAHASTHANAGSDPVTLAQSQITSLTTDLALKAPLASPALTGTPTVPTAAPGTNTTQAASTAFVAAAAALDLKIASNLSDLANAGTARTNLGLGALAVLNSITASLISDASANGRSLLTAADYAAMRALLFGAATAISGGGTLALGGFTLTAPATGTAALLATANVFTAVQSVSLDDSVTNAVSTLLTLNHSSSGTPAASFGTRLMFSLESDTTINQAAAAIDTIWIDATHATRTSALLFSVVYNGGALTEIARFQGGSSPTLLLVAGTRLDFGGGQAVIQNATSYFWRVTGAGAMTFLDNTAGNLNMVVGGGSVGIGITTAASKLHTITTDAATNTATTVLTLGHNTSGTPAASYGTAMVFQGQSTTTVNRDMASINAIWTTATDATRKARVTLNVYDTAAREWIRGEASGSAAMIGFLGANASARATITGSRTDGTALTSLLTELATKGLITDGTTA